MNHVRQALVVVQALPAVASVLPADMLTLVTLTTVISALRVNSAAQELPLVLLVLLGTVVPLVAVLL